MECGTSVLPQKSQTRLTQSFGAAALDSRAEIDHSPRSPLECVFSDLRTSPVQFHAWVTR
jgi:hypothetical protein